MGYHITHIFAVPVPHCATIFLRRKPRPRDNFRFATRLSLKTFLAAGSAVASYGDGLAVVYVISSVRLDPDGFRCEAVVQSVRRGRFVR